MAVKALAFPEDAIGHGLVGGMEFFEFPVGLEGFFVLLLEEIGIRHLELGQKSLIAVRITVPDLFEGLDGVVILLLFEILDAFFGIFAETDHSGAHNRNFSHNRTPLSVFYRSKK